MADSKATFQVGDVVRLASGGPKMTVAGDGELKGTLWCIWFDGSVPKGEAFDPRTLAKDE